jgi:acyl-homoserine lactone acylase PvdQ
MSSRTLLLALCAVLCLVFVPTAGAETSRYILPPGNYGGLPTTPNSRDQLPLYSGLTPLRRNVSRADVDRYFLPEDFKPIGAGRDEPTGRAGLRIVYDAYGVPHVYGSTRDDVSFGAGWVTARDRGLLLSLGRGPARVAVADVPGIDAFSLVTSAQSFTPSRRTEALVTRQRKLLVKVYGKKGSEIVHDAQTYIDGANAYQRSKGQKADYTVNDVIATTAFIGSIFGAGGGGEAENSDLLARLDRKYGAKGGKRRWSDVMLANDPEAPTTLKKRFSYPPLTGGKVRGSAVIDPGSIKAFSPTAGKSSVKVDAAQAPPRKRASNFQLVAPSRSASGKSLAVMGPQLGYYYPEIVEQMHLQGPGIRAQGAAVPGLAMYLLLGRTSNYAWSLTSAGHDVRDVYVERLCGAHPRRSTTRYLYKGKCRSMSTFDAGKLGSKELTFKTTVHGPVIGTATVHGRPYALSRRRSTFGRDALNLAALKDMTEGRGSSDKAFYKTANEFGFTFNWAYANRRGTANFSSGRLPVRPRGLDRRLPTKGTGKYEWRGYLTEAQHPHGATGPGGLLLNWNNRSAPGFMHGDDEPYGSVQRVELFNRFPKKAKIEDVVGVMNRAASEDVRSPAWPSISRVLHSGKAPDARSAKTLAAMDAWVRRDAPRVDADNDGTFDAAGPAIMDALWLPLAKAVMRPRFGNLLGDLDKVRSLASLSGVSYVDKDLRTLLHEHVRGKFNVAYCGKGKLAACRRSLWRVVDQVSAGLAAKQGANPTAWREKGDRIAFVPGLIPDSTPFTNRPTFQQVLELDRR